MSGAERMTNAQVAALLTEVKTTMTAVSAHLPSEEQAKAIDEIRATQKTDHDALIALGTDMQYVKEAAERWDDNHTVVSNLRQRVGLLSWVGGVLSAATLIEGIRRAIDYFVP